MLSHHKFLVPIAIIIIFLIVVFTSCCLRKRFLNRQLLGGCALPEQYTNGEYSGNYTHGQTINAETYIRINCNANYTPYPAEQSICLNNTWSSEFPRCVRTCPAITFQVEKSSCELNGVNGDCTKPMLEGTIAHMKCKQSLVISRCVGGYWSNKTALDELLSHCPVFTKSLPVRIKSQAGCKLPKKFINGKYTLTGNYSRGLPISDETYVRIRCNANYAPYPTKHCACLNNSWSPEFPRCVQTCPAITSDIVEISCKLNDTKEDCAKPMLEGTIAHMKCKNYYEFLGSSNPLSRCVNGSWDIPIIKCTPECGHVISSGQTAIIDGVRAIKGDFPWHVAIYRKREQDTNFTNICGGSIISRKVVLSAAHCFARDEDGLYRNASYIVGAGKFYREYESSLDYNAQYRVVQKTLIQSTYGGQKTNYQDDIAIVIVEKPFEITQFVQPVCLDWSNELESLQLRENAYGTVVGWGYTREEGNSANELQKLTVPYKSRGACLEIVPDSFHRFVTTDKFCAGFTNGSAVCQGDSGGGLVFYWPRNRKYYIRGIVSISPLNQATCHSHQLTAYTRITNELLLWISTAESENRFWYSDTDTKLDCTLPRKFLHGKYIVFGNYISDEPVNNGTIVTIQCNPTYASYPASFTTCLDNRWSPKFPRCVRACPAIISDSVDVYCELDGHEEVCTRPVVEGTIAHMKCKNSYIPLDIDNSASLCEGGSWDMPIIKCIIGANKTKPEGCTLPRQFLNGNYTVFGNHNSSQRVGNGHLVKINCNKNFKSYPSNITACFNNNWSTKLFPKCIQCGRVISSGQTAIIDGVRAKKGDFPWNVAIYRKREQDTNFTNICGGSIISREVVLSAAHCFARDEDGLYRNASYIVGAGKFYRDYESSLDYNAQYRVVQKTIIQSTYGGQKTNYQDDIAIVIVEKPFEITQFVQPVGIDWSNKLQENANRIVSGWGYTAQEGNSDNELQQFIVPCKSQGADLENGSAVSQGDSGGGLAFYLPHNTKYHIQGIVNISPINQTISHFYQLIADTKITNELLLWIIKIESENRFWYNGTDIKLDCTFPRKFLHGRYNVFGNCIYDEVVNSGTIVTIQCNANYAPYPASFTTCLGNRWSPKFPKCVRACPALISDSVDVYCELDGHEEVCTRPVVEGTIAHMKCKDSYIPLDIDNSASLCKGGSWDIPIIKCITGANKTTPEGCMLPRQFLNGNYIVFANSNPSHQVGNGYFVIINCDKNFESYPSNITACLNNNWSTKLFPKCIQVCPALISESVEISCQFDDLKRNCTKPMPEGTVAHMKCKRFYQSASTNNPVARCLEGSWDISILKCVPECGKEIPAGVPFVREGIQPNVGKFPWHVTVYRKTPQDTDFRNICSGSIISRTLVLSAAHCVFRNDGLRINETYIVGAGKYYSEYKSPFDHSAQYRAVKLTLVPSTYRGFDTNYRDDIAIIIIEELFEITVLVQPICIDWDNHLETSQLKENNNENRVNWGYSNTDGSFSNELQQWCISYNSRTRCITVVPIDLFRFVTTDKFFNGCTNESAVCAGDSGGGLAFYWPDNKIYYIRGIMSIVPFHNSSCDKHQYGTYTRISDELLRWISHNEAENRIYD